MPLTALVRQLQQAPLTGELLQRSQRPERLRLSGASRAARALVSSALAGSAEAMQRLIEQLPADAGYTRPPGGGFSLE